MNPEDFPLFIFEGVRYRMVPELPRPHVGFRCEGCAACPVGRGLDRELCGRMYKAALAIGRELDCSEGDDNDLAYIFVPEENFQDYVVELVRRRVSG